MTQPPDRLPVRVLGRAWHPRVHQIKDFLARNRVPYVWTDLDRAPAGLVPGSEGELPLLLFPDGSRLADPSDVEIADRIGLSTETQAAFYDLVVVGAGPTGLAAAVYAASEGLRTLVVEREAPGGQAGQSARIENYLGFPEGVTGAELAERALRQARRFGAEVVVARAATRLTADGEYRVLTLDGGEEVAAHTMLIATGVDWRILEAPGCQELCGAGIYYGAAVAEAAAVRGKDVYLLGGGNSAGQAALLLARYARSVTMLAVEESFDEKMSKYLLDRIDAASNIHMRPCCTVSQATGERALESITIENVRSGESERVPAEALFVFIGAAPDTAWLEGTLERDEQGFLLAGGEVPREGGGAWKLERDPLPLETSLCGVFAAGDVRSGSVKRVASAVGEGSVAVQYVHQYLADR